MTVALTGGSGTITYQWQSSPDGTTGWANATGTGSTTATFTLSTPGTTYYRFSVNASNSGCVDKLKVMWLCDLLNQGLYLTAPASIAECEAEQTK
jgi:hypothetical protein